MECPVAGPIRVLRAFVFGVLALVFLCPAQLPAQTITGTEDDWKSTASGNWNTNANWSTGAYPQSSSDTATFTSTSSTNTPGINGLTLSIRGIVWKSGAAAYTISSGAGGGASITLGVDGLQNYSSNTQVLSGSKLSLVLGASTFFDVGSTGGLTISPG